MANALHTRAAIVLPSSTVVEHTPAAVLDDRVSPVSVRVLTFVEARGVTGTLRNLLDLANYTGDAVRFEFATYWRSRRPGVPGDDTDSIQQAIDAAAECGIRTHVLHERYAGDPRLIAQLRHLLRRTTADIIETHHVKSHALVAACGVPIADRWVAYHHGYTTTTVKTRVLNLLDYWSLTKPAAIVTPCRAFAGELSGRGIDPARITVVHSAVERPARSPLNDVRARLALGSEDRLVLAVGRLSKEKAHSVLVEAFARFPSSLRSRAALVIAGEGPEREPLLALARRHALKRVHLVGHLPDIWPYYDAADVVALPSDSEGSPNALLEAMAAGTPVVATHVGGVPDIVEHGRSGLLVRPRDPDALASALTRVLEDAGLATVLAERARSIVRECFTVDTRARTLTALYRRLSRA